MDSDLLIPLLWTVIFGGFLTLGVRRLFKKTPTKKRWVRPEPKSKEEDSN